MPVEIGEILVQAELADEEWHGRGGTGFDEEGMRRFRSELLEEVRRMIRDELDRRTRR